MLKPRSTKHVSQCVHKNVCFKFFVVLKSKRNLNKTLHLLVTKDCSYQNTDKQLIHFVLLLSVRPVFSSMNANSLEDKITDYDTGTTFIHLHSAFRGRVGRNQSPVM